MDYCDAFISRLNSHSDGTHWWAIDIMPAYPNLFWWRNKLIYILDGLKWLKVSQIKIFGWIIPFKHISHTKHQKSHTPQKSTALNKAFGNTNTMLVKAAERAQKSKYKRWFMRNAEGLVHTASLSRVPVNQRVWAWSLIKAILLSAEPGITAKESKYTHCSEQGHWREQKR